MSPDFGHRSPLPELEDAERSISLGDARYRTLIEAAEDPIFELDRAGNYLFINEAGARRLGLEREAMVGRNVRDFFPADAARMLEPLDSLFSTGKPASILRKAEIAGRNVDFSAVLVPLKNDEGAVKSVLVIARDVTWIKALATSAKRNHRRVRELFRNMGEGVGIVDAEECFQFANPAAHVILGAPPRQLKNRSLRDFVTEEGWKQILSQTSERRHGARSTYQLEIVRPDGERRYLQVTATARHSRSGKYLGAFGVFLDITLQKKADEALRRASEELEQKVRERTAELCQVVEELHRQIREREEAVEAQKISELRFRALFDSALETIFIKDRDFRYVEVNAGMERLFQRTAAELVGKSDSELFGQEDGQTMRADDETVLAGGIVDKESTKVVNGVKHVFHVIKVPMRDSSGAITGLCGIARDVTQRKAAEEEIRESQERLRLLTAYVENSRDEESKRISREIHDELGQNLTVAKFELASLRKMIPADHPELDSRLASLSERMGSVSEDVRRIARNLRPPLLDHFGLDAALENLVRDFEQKTGIRCEIDLQASDMRIEESTATAVFRICQEALTNVARHSGAGLVKLTLSCNEDQLQVEIADDGRGIEPAETRKPTLGLLGMEERARRLGGSLYIGPAQFKGTKLDLAIPLPKSSDPQ